MVPFIISIVLILNVSVLNHNKVGSLFTNIVITQNSYLQIIAKENAEAIFFLLLKES